MKYLLWDPIMEEAEHLRKLHRILYRAIQHSSNCPKRYLHPLKLAR
jgi:hypothetical protein